MSEFVFILGAGASVHAKVPVMAKFLDRARELYGPNMEPPWKEHFERVLKILSVLQSVHSKAELDLNNLEAVFTTFELGQTIRKLPGVDDLNFEAAVNSLKALIVYTIEQSMEFPLNESRNLSASEDYAAFASLIVELKRKDRMRSRGVSVITFNYDIGAEVAFEELNLPYEYFVERQTTSGGLLKLLKLHGSINWGQDLTLSEIVSLPVRHLLSSFDSRFMTMDQSLTHLRLPVDTNFVRLVKNFLQADVAPIPVIVPPGLFKTEYQGSISRVWQEAAIELESAKEIIAIGYSLPETDFFFRNLYALGTVGENFIKRFAVFNPDDSGLVKGRFKSLLGPGARDRFEYYPSTFKAAIQMMSN
jgi:hypothetical protein